MRWEEAMNNKDKILKVLSIWVRMKSWGAVKKWVILVMAIS